MGYIRGMLPPRRHEISRVEAFSDAVFGFALALLVVSSQPPVSYAELMDRMIGAVPFACSFALLVWIWYEHYAFFRRYGLHDAYTIVLNSVLLFVVLLYVYPLKFMFDSAFARILPRLAPPEGMQLYQLANAVTVYAVGFIAIFVLFALLYRHAFAKRVELGLSELEIFDAKINMRHHLLSVERGRPVAAHRRAGPARARADIADGRTRSWDLCTGSTGTDPAAARGPGTAARERHRSRGCRRAGADRRTACVPM